MKLKVMVHVPSVWHDEIVLHVETNNVAMRKHVCVCECVFVQRNYHVFITAALERNQCILVFDTQTCQYTTYAIACTQFTCATYFYTGFSSVMTTLS